MTKNVVGSVHVPPTFSEQHTLVRNAAPRLRVYGAPVEQNSFGTESNKTKR